MEPGTFFKLIILAIAVLIYIYLAVRFGSWGFFVSKKQFNNISEKETEENDKKQ